MVDRLPAERSRTQRARWLLAGLAAALLGVAVALWRFTPLAEWAAPERLALGIGRIEDAPWLPAAVIGLFVAGGLIAFPLLLLITATAIVFEPATAFGLSFAGTLANASLTYAIGARYVRGTARQAFGPALQKVSAVLRNTGIVAVVIARNVPLAPFTVVNIAAGSVGVRFRDYLIGTALGVAPGILMLTVFGRQLRALVHQPTLPSLAVLLAVVISWIALSIVLQRAVSRRSRTDRSRPG